MTFLVAVGFAPARADDKPTAKPVTPEAVEKAILDLGSGRFAVREAATKYLWAAGSAAEPALEAATKNPDVEIARRSKEILDRFRWGIYPDSPKEILALIEQFR